MTFALSSNSILLISVADPYHFDTDPDPGSEKIRYGSGSGSRANFDTDPDPDKKDKDLDPDPAKKRLSTRKIFKSDEKRSNQMFCGCRLLINHLSRILVLLPVVVATVKR